MSLLPNLTATSVSGVVPSFLFPTVGQFNSLSNALSTVNISTATGAGVSVSEPTANNFVFSNALSNAGGISFVSVPGSTTLGLSNAGVTGLVAGSGVSVSGATGNVTVGNTGVTSLVAGSGIGVSGGTGAVTVSNSGVLSVTAGTNVSITGTASAPVINATSAALSPTVIRDQFTTSPASTNSVGGSATVAATFTGLTPGKIYLINLNGAMAGVNSSTGEMVVQLSFPGLGEVVIMAQMPNSGNTFGIAASACIVVPVGQTSLDLEVAGSGVGGGDTITLRTDNLVITQLN